MSTDQLRKGMAILGLLLAVWLGGKYLLPVLLPFLLGTLLALAAEPVVRLGSRRLHMSRTVAAGLGVSLTLLFLAGLLSVLGALAVKELGTLAGSLPDARQGMVFLQDKLVQAAQGLPEGMRSLATGKVLEMFNDGSVLLEQVSASATGAVKSVLGWLPDGALGLGTGVLAGFMISARLPRLQGYFRRKLPESWKESCRRVGTSVWGWVKAQGKLMAVTYGIVALGLTVLGVRYGFFWALLIALVDAVPILGTGTVLVPWAVTVLLQGQTLRGVGLLAVYGAAMLTRTVLEPRLVGRHLGLDPLVTLIFLYMGYRFWGFLGMVLAPMLASAVKNITQPTAQ